MSCVARKPVFGVSDQVWHKLGCTATEDSYRLQILDQGSRGIVLSICSKNKDADQLCGYSATDLRICFCIYAKSRFSHDAAQIAEQISLLYNMLVKKSAVSRYMYL